TTSTPALARWAAMPLPITPAPMTPALRMGAEGEWGAMVSPLAGRGGYGRGPDFFNGKRQGVHEGFLRAAISRSHPGFPELQSASLSAFSSMYSINRRQTSGSHSPATARTRSLSSAPLSSGVLASSRSAATHARHDGSNGRHPS